MSKWREEFSTSFKLHKAQGGEEDGEEAVGFLVLNVSVFAVVA